MKQRDLAPDLAYSLDIRPEQVLQYKQYPEGYTVLTTDFKKFTRVQPTAPPEPSAYPPGMPEELAAIFNEPYTARVQELRNLAYFLEIPDASALKKAALQEEIESWKKAHQ